MPQGEIEAKRLDAVAAYADIPIIEVDGRSQWPGMRRILSPTRSPLVAYEMPTWACSSQAHS